mmetsp:Transcript_14502/g.12766  ORF Transcript_14502/g.12766 Transcript_14502/m.12766 type:complete len:89 (+) Transcript_14502:352-618(+)
MYKLTKILYKNERFAYYSALFFTLNLCTRFYTSLYTESLYTFLSLLGMMVIYSHEESVKIHKMPFWRIILSSIILAINVICRSNALLF